MKTIGILILTFLFSCNFIVAQDTLYIYKSGTVLYKQIVSNIDSVTFKNKKTVQETVTDIDGNVYHTVKIGTQTWMVENLKTTKYRDGNGGTIPNVSDNYTWFFTTDGAYCNYNDDEANGLKYGRLYNWYAITDNRKLAPAGWHVATDAEWTTLVNYLIANGYNYDGTKDDNRAAKSLASTTEWVTSNGPGSIGNDLTKNNTTGFTALPGGYRTGTYPSTFDYIGNRCYWWSSDGTNPFCRHLENNSSYVFRDDSYTKKYGFYVRCVKD